MRNWSALLFRQASSYGLGLLLTRGGQILFLPYLMYTLAARDFGIIGLHQLLSNLLLPVFGFGMHSAVLRLYPEWSEDSRPKHIFTLWVFSLVVSGFICFLLWVLGPVFLSFLGGSAGSFKPYFMYSLVISFCQGALLFPNALLRSQERILTYNSLSFACLVSQAVLLYFLLPLGVLGYFYAYFYTYLGLFFLTCLSQVKRIRFSFQRSELKAAVKFALPLLPAGLLEAGSTSLDRMLLERYVSLSQLGIYSLARQWAAALNLLNNALKSAWLPLSYRLLSQAQTVAPVLLARLAKHYLAFAMLAALSLALLLPPLLGPFLSDELRPALIWIPPLVFANLALCFDSALGRGLDLAKRTGLSFIVPLLGCFVGLFTLPQLLPEHGLLGAVLGINAILWSKAVCQIILAQYYYPRPTAHYKLLINLGLGTGMFFCAYMLEMGIGERILLLAICCIPLTRSLFKSRLF